MTTVLSAAPRRRVTLAVAACLCLPLLSACTNDDGEARTAEPTRTATVSPAASVSSTRPPSPKATSLAQSFDRQQFGDDVGVAITPVGGGEVILLGNQDPRVAWSTIKVPLAIAASRHNPKLESTIETAIVNSDNDAALKLRKSLGDPESARQAVTQVFRDAGDDTTVAVKIQSDDETFGLTEWPLAGAAKFTAGIACMDEAAGIVGYMGEVAGNQQWGVETMVSDTAVKGGWGPGDGGGYEVRQIGIITRKDKKQVAVAMSTYRPGDPMEAGTKTLNAVSKWLEKNLARLPAGRCS